MNESTENDTQVKRKNTIFVWLKRFFLSLLILCLAVYFSIFLFINRPYTSVFKERPSEAVYYLSYGSNMSSRYLSNIRNVDIYESLPVSIGGHEVKFNLKGIPDIEPAFANMIVSEGKTSYGVAHLVTPESLNSIVGSESGSYQMREISVTTLDQKEVNAWALIGEDNQFNAIPSQRYLDIMVEGAEQHGLDADYIDELRKYDGTYIPIVSEAIGTLIHLMVIKKSY